MRSESQPSLSQSSTGAWSATEAPLPNKSRTGTRSMPLEGNAMGRRRTHDRHLPRRMYLDHGTYWFRPKIGKAVNLGRELADALAKYAAIIGTQWSGRTLGDVIDRYR